MKVIGTIFVLFRNKKPLISALAENVSKMLNGISTTVVIITVDLVFIKSQSNKPVKMIASCQLINRVDGSACVFSFLAFHAQPIFFTLDFVSLLFWLFVKTMLYNTIRENNALSVVEDGFCYTLTSPRRNFPLNEVTVK